MTQIPTIYGPQEPSADDLAYMDYLDDLTDELPGGYGFGLLLFKADPSAFAAGCYEWKAQQADETGDDDYDDDGNLRAGVDHNEAPDR